MARQDKATEWQIIYLKGHGNKLIATFEGIAKSQIILSNNSMQTLKIFHYHQGQRWCAVRLDYAKKRAYYRPVPLSLGL